MKYMGGMKNCFCFSLSKKELTFEIIHWELFCKTGVLRCVCVCVFTQEIEVFQGRRNRVGGCGGSMPPPSPHSIFCLEKKKKKGRTKERKSSKQKILKGCHQGQNVTLSVILERLEFKIFWSTNHGGLQCFSVFHDPSTLKSISPALCSGQYKVGTH